MNAEQIRRIVASTNPAHTWTEIRLEREREQAQEISDYRFGWSLYRRGYPVPTQATEPMRAGWAASQDCDAALRAVGVR